MCDYMHNECDYEYEYDYKYEYKYEYEYEGECAYEYLGCNAVCIAFHSTVV